MQTFAMDNALSEWGLSAPAQARIAFFLRRFVRPDGTINMLNWNSNPEGPPRCPFNGPADANDTALPQFNDGLADYGRTIDMWVHSVELGSAGEATDTFVAQTLPPVLTIGRYLLALRLNATSAIPASSPVHGLVFGPAEHDTCPYSDYYLNVNVWCWRGLARLGNWLAAAGREPALAAQLLDNANTLRAQLHAAVAASSVPLPSGGAFVPPILGKNMQPWVNMTQDTPVGPDGHSIPSYTNFRYYGESLLAAGLPPSIEVEISSFREAHGGTLSGMTRYTDHLDDMPALGYGYSSLLHGSSEKFHGLLFGHLANYHSHGTFFTSEQMSIYGDGVHRDMISAGCVECVDANYCLPASMLPAFFLKWMLVFTPPDRTEELWLAREAPRRWFSAEGFAVDRAPTHLGSVSFAVSATRMNNNGPWVVTAHVTVTPKDKGFQLIQLRMRAPPAAVHATMGSASVVGAQLVSQNNTAELVTLSCPATGVVSFTATVAFSVSPVKDATHLSMKKNESQELRRKSPPLKLDDTLGMSPPLSAYFQCVEHCSDKSLCSSMSPQPDYSTEVVATVSGAARNGFQYGENGTEWRNWLPAHADQVTSMPVFNSLQGLGSGINEGLICEAHRHNIRVVDEDVVNGGFNVEFVTQPHQFANESAVDIWVEEVAHFMLTVGIDGVNLVRGDHSSRSGGEVAPSPFSLCPARL